MKKFTKILSLVLAAFFAFSAFSFTSEAKMLDTMQTKMEAHKRQLTVDEIKTIYNIFNYKEYAAMYPDLKAAFGDDEVALYTHFVTCGIWEERKPCAVFNVDVYATFNNDLAKVYGDDIVAYYLHYATHQWEAGRDTPTEYRALWRGLSVYSVYDFEKGTGFPKQGSVPVFTPYYHPEILMN